MRFDPKVFSHVLGLVVLPRVRNFLAYATRPRQDLKWPVDRHANGFGVIERHESVDPVSLGSRSPSRCTTDFIASFVQLTAARYISKLAIVITEALRFQASPSTT